MIWCVCSCSQNFNFRRTKRSYSGCWYWSDRSTPIFRYSEDIRFHGNRSTIPLLHWRCFHKSYGLFGTSNGSQIKHLRLVTAIYWCTYIKSVWLTYYIKLINFRIVLVLGQPHYLSGNSAACHYYWWCWACIDWHDKKPVKTKQRDIKKWPPTIDSNLHFWGFQSSFSRWTAAAFSQVIAAVRHLNLWEVA